MEVCGARTKTTGRPCDNPVRAPGLRCWRHGGLRAPASSGRRAASSYSKRTNRGVIIGITVTIAGIGVAALTIPGNLSLGGASLSPDVPSAGADVPKEISIDLDRTQATLIAAGYAVNPQIRFDKNCAENSYGSVQHFFLANPCVWLARASFTLRESGSLATLVAVSWVDMNNTEAAMQYKKLVDAPDTGNITELTRVSGPYQSIRFTGRFYASGIDGTTVWNAEVQPVANLPLNTVDVILNDSRQ